MDDYPYLKRVTKMILVLIHGQAFVQKGFNVNKNLLQSNLEGLPLTSQRLIYDHLVAIDLTPESIAISKELRDSMRKAGSRQRIEYEDRKERSVWCKKAKSQCDSKWYKGINPLSGNPTKCSNTLKQFVGKLPTNCLSVVDHFVKLALKALR